MTFLHETLFQWRTYIFHFDRIHSCLKVKTWFFAAGWLWRLWLLTDYKLRSLSDCLGTKWLAGWLVSFLVSVCYFGYVPYLENYFYWVLKIYKQFRMLAVLDYNRRSCFAFVINQYYPPFFELFVIILSQMTVFEKSLFNWFQWMIALKSFKITNCLLVNCIHNYRLQQRHPHLTDQILTRIIMVIILSPKLNIM